jgi:hypothetical protein
MMAQECVYMYHRLCASEGIDSSQCLVDGSVQQGQPAEGSSHHHFISVAPCLMSLDPIECYRVLSLAAGPAHLLCFQNDIKCPLLCVFVCVCVRGCVCVCVCGHCHQVAADLILTGIVEMHRPSDALLRLALSVFAYLSLSLSLSLSLCVCVCVCVRVRVIVSGCVQSLCASCPLPALPALQQWHWGCGVIGAGS